MKYLLFAFAFFVNDCQLGWSIAGYSLEPTENNADIPVIVDVDSIEHMYKEINYDGYDFCLIHYEYEDIKKVEK